MKIIKTKNVDEYIALFPKTLQQLLRQMRKTIKAVAPNSEESISYGMPAYKYKGRPLVYFAGFENHIGFYATPTGNKMFNKELAEYKTGKGSIQFPVDKPLPLALINKIVLFRLQENEEKAIVKKKK